jgi:hypothetical protein
MPTTSPAKMNPKQDDADSRLHTLRELLLAEDRMVQENIGQEVNQLKDILLEEDKLEAHLKVHFEGQVKYLQEHFPKLFGRYLGEAIKLQIKSSQNDIIDALYPIIGKMIGRYLKAEIQRISQQIDEKLQNPFSFENIKLRLKSIFSGVSYHEVLMEEVARAELQEIFVIDKESGMLLGHHSLEGITHPDMVAGMLKGLQDFVEHALERASEELEFLEYESHTFLLHHFQTVTFAIVVDGELNATFRSRLRQYVYDFYEKHPVHATSNINRAEQEALAQQLKQHFDGFNQVDQ